MKTKLLLLFALLISACAAPTSNTPQSVATDAPANEVPASPEPTQLPVQGEPSPTTESVPALTMTTYTDDFAGFSLDYPAGWSIESSALVHAEESTNYSISIASWDILNPPTPDGKQTNGLPGGGTKIDVTVIKEPMTLEEAVSQVSRTGTPILAQKDVTLAAGQPAVLLDIEGFAGLARMLITNLNGNVIYVTGYGNLENFESIALTLRPK